MIWSTNMKVYKPTTNLPIKIIIHAADEQAVIPCH